MDEFALDNVVVQARKLMDYCKKGGHKMFPIEIRMNSDGAYEIQSNHRHRGDTITFHLSSAGEYMNFSMAGNIEALE